MSKVRSSPDATKLIQEAYNALDRASESSSEASRLVGLAYDAAAESERRHRRGAPYCADRKALVSVDTAAKFFVVKWACEPVGKKKSLLEASGLRLECLYAGALGELLRSRKRYPFKGTPEAAKLDYAAFCWGAK